MYEIYVSSKDFKDKRTVQQHRMVNEVNLFVSLLAYSENTVNIYLNT